MKTQPEPSFRDLVDLLRRGFWFAVAFAATAAAVTFVVSNRVDETYRATTTLYVAPTSPNLESFGVSVVTAPGMDLSAYASAAVIGPVLVETLDRLGSAEPTPQEVSDFLARIEVDSEATQSSGLLYLSVLGASPDAVAAVANALGDSLMSWDRERSTRALRQIVTTLETQIGALDQQIVDAQAAGEAGVAELEGLQALRTDQRQQLLLARTLATSAVGRLELFEPAVPPVEPIAPNPMRNAVLTGVLALLLGYLIVLARRSLSGEIRDVDELARITQQPILAEFGQQRKRGRRFPRSRGNFLRTNVAFALPKDERPKVIVVTSAIGDQGTTSVAISLAESFAHHGDRTLLIDADLRSPALGKEFDLVRGLRGSVGDYTSETPDALGTSRVDVGLGHGIDVLPSPAGVDAPTEFLTRYFEPVLDRARASYDTVVINSAPVLPYADTLAIAPHASLVLLVVNMPTARARDVRSALGLLARSQSRVGGVVANRVARENGHAGSGGFAYEPPTQSASAPGARSRS